MHAPHVVLVLCVALLTAAPAAAYQREMEDLGTQVAERLTETELRAVAVQDFTDLEGNVSELGRFLAEELSAVLVASADGAGGGGPRVIDRLRLGQILDEMELQSSSLVNPEEIRQLGRIAGVDALVTGRITAFSDTLRLRIRVLDSETAEELMAEATDLPRTPSLAELEKRSLRVEVKPGECGDVAIDLEDRAPRSLVIDDQEIALLGCVRVGETVHCVLELTSRQEDRSFYLFGNSRLVLPDGTQVPAERVSVGSSIATGSKGKAGNVLVEGIALAATASFGPVPAGVESIQLLELLLQGDDARFLDVPIERP